MEFYEKKFKNRRLNVLYKIIWNKIIINQCHYYNSVGEEKLNFDGHGKNNWKAIKLKWEPSWKLRLNTVLIWLQTHNKKINISSLYEIRAIWLRVGLLSPQIRCEKYEMRDAGLIMRSRYWALIGLHRCDLNIGTRGRLRTGISSTTSEQWPGPPAPLPRL